MMKKYLFRIFAGIVAFSVSASLAAIDLSKSKITSVSVSEISEVDNTKPEDLSNFTENVTVKFGGFEKVGNRPILNLEIANNTNTAVNYSPLNGKYLTNADAFVKVNEKSIGNGTLLCFFGSEKEYSLPSGKSLNVKIYLDVLDFDGKESAIFKVGFLLKTNKGAEKVFWSDQIKMPIK